MTDSLEATSKAQDTRKLYQLLKQATWRNQQVSKIIRLRDGHVITDLSVRVSRWQELFQKLFNSSHHPQITPSPPQVVFRAPYYKVCLEPSRY
jgi:hypothetical protein